EDEVWPFVLDAGGDGGGAGEGDLAVDGRRDGVGDGGQERRDPVDHVDDVRARLPAHDDGAVPLSVCPGRDALVLDAVEDPGDVGEPDDAVVADRDGNVFVVGGVDELIGGRQHHRLLRAVDRSVRLA